ncbi:MAG: GNAT family N-acetyltransferase [Lachnospiraceae bacterium]|nr:GNAT family N-acetyltransferase [Lachnospiraceae bacterium]
MVVKYEDKYEDAWDEFVLHNSINGNFLQTRKFLNYHPNGRFLDASILFMKDGEIAAVIPANEVDNGNILLAHQGSTYGGLVVGEKYANSTNYDWIFAEMISYFKEKGYKRAEMSMHSWLYSPCEKHHELCEYYFQINGFSVRSEIGFFIDLSCLDENFESSFEKLKRRKLNKAKRQGLTLKKLSTDTEVEAFYNVLKENMKKFDTVPVHTKEEILDFKNMRLAEVTSFYGVYHEDKMIAGSMVWNFCDKKVFHTQYLASLHDYLDMCPNEFLYAGLIQAAKEGGYRFLSYGTASLNNGRTYNESLGMYKEGFNTDSYMNRCYIWERG